MGAVLMAIELREYQQAAIDAVYDYWAEKRGDNPLVVAPTGSGKSLIIGKLIEDAMAYAGTRVLILTHVKELLEQNAQELLAIYPQADFAFYSASIGQKRLDKPITFAGIQSIWERAPDMIPAPDLVIIDEAHMLPKKATTRYGKFIGDLRQCNPAVKIVGLTATPYRLDSGYLHKGEGAIFDGIAYDIPVAMLMEQGYLAPVISRGSTNKIDLSNVSVRGGEYVESELAAAASDPELVRQTVTEIVAVGQDRKAWLIFASGVGHAEMILDELRVHNIPADLVVGSDDMRSRGQKIEAFRRGALRALVNVNVLTTGFNVPRVDLVALVRATLSTALYVQMVGRGTRTAPGKQDCMVLDYGDNVMRHGFIDAVRIREKGQGDGVAPTKGCPDCQTMCHASVRVCPACGHQFPAPELNHNHKSYGGAMLSTQVEPEWVNVDSVSYARHEKAGKPPSIRVTYQCGLTRVNEWLCPDHGGYAASRYHARMKAMSAFAMTTDDALLECGAWKKPGRIKIKPKGEFFEIMQLDYNMPLAAAKVVSDGIDYDDLPF